MKPWNKAGHMENYDLSCTFDFFFLEQLYQTIYFILTELSFT